MRFDYRIAKEATFKDWVQDGLDKAYALINFHESMPQNNPNKSEVKPQAR